MILRDLIFIKLIILGLCSVTFIYSLMMLGGRMLNFTRVATIRELSEVRLFGGGGEG